MWQASKQYLLPTIQKQNKILYKPEVTHKPVIHSSLYKISSLVALWIGCPLNAALLANLRFTNIL